MPELLPVVAAFFTTGAGEAIGAGVASAGVGAGLSALLRPKMPNINIPPPPGAAMIDPSGAQAAASQRTRAAAAGGLQSTITGAGSGPASASTGPTSGGKQLLGS